ncbi:gluconate:H+ symporter [Henriciella sp.]|uniref:GntT/GntP/DsdX family permease n=1 Tax=Henriciella sp. TaxID=1968823 RepID=UPI0026399D6D|nr:gluconate:H+ symporter [Henriciella sp.]
MDSSLIGLLIIIGGIAALLAMIILARIPAFIALLMTSIGVALAAGMPADAIMGSIRDGMGGTLGFVAVVVGLGAMLGAILEHSGGIQSLSRAALSTAGPRGAQWALAGVGVAVSIPVFFDVAFIILAPMLFGLARRSGRPVLWFAIPALAGMGMAHTFLPPTPGPIAVADLIGANLGWVFLTGLATGVPAVLLGGILFAPMASRLAGPVLDAGPASLPEALGEAAPETDGAKQPSALSVLLIILAPLALIVLGAFAEMMPVPEGGQVVLTFIGHPFAALLIACSIAYVVLGLSHDFKPEALNKVMAKSLEPAGVIVLITGAGGAFKQVLVDSQLGTQIADLMVSASLAPIVMAFAIAAILRVAQGSATVAMITSGTLVSAMIDTSAASPVGLALIVSSIASGAIVCSHVNDSGFWLVSRYLGLTETQTLKTWTVMTTIIGLSGFVIACLIALAVT